MRHSILKKGLRIGLASVLVSMLIMAGAPLSAGAEEAAPQEFLNDTQAHEEQGADVQVPTAEEVEATDIAVPEAEAPAPEAAEATTLSEPDTSYQPLWVQVPNSNITYRISSALSSNKLLDVPEASKDLGRQILIWDNNQGSHQVFSFVPSSVSGWFYIKNLRSGYVLDIEKSIVANGTPIIQWPASGGDNQLWQYWATNNGLILVSKKNTNYCIDLANASITNGSKMILWTRHGGANQAFNISEAGWAQDSGKWYYYSNGAKLTNSGQRALPDETGKYWWFEFDSSGAALTGEHWVGNVMVHETNYYDGRGRLIYKVNESFTNSYAIITGYRYDGLYEILDYSYTR